MEANKKQRSSPGVCVTSDVSMVLGTTTSSVRSCSAPPPRLPHLPCLRVASTRRPSPVSMWRHGAMDFPSSWRSGFRTCLMSPSSSPPSPDLQTKAQASTAASASSTARMATSSSPPNVTDLASCTPDLYSLTKKQSSYRRYRSGALRSTPQPHFGLNTPVVVECPLSLGGNTRKILTEPW